MSLNVVILAVEFGNKKTGKIFKNILLKSSIVF